MMVGHLRCFTKCELIVLFLLIGKKLNSNGVITKRKRRKKVAQDDSFFTKPLPGNNTKCQLLTVSFSIFFFNLFSFNLS